MGEVEIGAPVQYDHASDSLLPPSEAEPLRVLSPRNIGHSPFAAGKSPGVIEVCILPVGLHAFNAGAVLVA